MRIPHGPQMLTMLVSVGTPNLMILQHLIEGAGSLQYAGRRRGFQPRRSFFYVHLNRVATSAGDRSGSDVLEPRRGRGRSG